MSVTVCIPTIPPRAGFLARALDSITAQSSPPAAISIALDLQREGAASTRTRAVAGARTPWVALLDDDDWMYPDHLEQLLTCAEATRADYVFSYFDVIGGADPLGAFGRPFDPADPHQTTTTILVRTDLAQQVRWQPPEPDELIDGQVAGEDWRFTLGCLAAGARIVHLPRRTWAWAHHGSNTSGRPDRW